MDVYLTEKLQIEMVDNVDFFAVGVDNRKVIIHIPIKIDLEMSVERPDKRILGPYKYDLIEAANEYMYVFNLQEIAFRQVGDMQFTLRITDDTKAVYIVNVIAHNSYAVPAFSDVDNLTLESVQQDILNIYSILQTGGYNNGS